MVGLVFLFSGLLLFFLCLLGATFWAAVSRALRCRFCRKGPGGVKAQVEEAIDRLLEEAGIEEEASLESAPVEVRLKVLRGRQKRAIQFERYEEAGELQREIERIQRKRKTELL